MKATVLLVDDEALARTELGGILQDEGYAVITAADGEEGLEAFRRHRPDMVITDARMPRREGLSLASAIIAENPHIPITMITGHGSESMVIEALRRGITDFIKKPVHLTDLLAALDRMENARALAGQRADGTAALPRVARLVSKVNTYEMGNDLSSVPQFVEAIVADVTTGLDRARRDGLNLALRELVLNGIEHGNLGITFEEKTEATERGSLAELLEARAHEPDRRDRKVIVTTARTDDLIRIVVDDGGEGFDWRSLPDPTDPANLLRAHGRGVLLATLSVDELTFDGSGSRVTILSHLTQARRKRGDAS